MPLCIYQTGDDQSGRLGLVMDDMIFDVSAGGGPVSLSEALHVSAEALHASLERVTGGESLPLETATLLAPLDFQEVWAAGVTYLRSRDARMEESQEKSVYDRVYEADRPELFMKATPNRVSGPGQEVGVRGDSTWDVPEPECVLAINSGGEIVGYTIGNDVSSRSIEGENPLYLPQAKMYENGAGLGPVIALTWEVTDPGNLPIRLSIRRDGAEVFAGETNTNQMHRTFDDLRDYLFRHNSFDYGVFLMTGTGIVPPSEFTLDGGDVVSISIEGIGTLVNPVVRL
ncbi:fumarylacetoacetate hydrolase family protein [soil metagenome]